MRSFLRENFCIDIDVTQRTTTRVAPYHKRRSQRPNMVGRAARTLVVARWPLRCWLLRCKIRYLLLLSSILVMKNQNHYTIDGTLKTSAIVGKETKGLSFLRVCLLANCFAFTSPTRWRLRHPPDSV